MRPSPGPTRNTAGAVDRLAAAINAHDLEALVACFDADFVNDTPAHPDRSFSGAAQVRENWARIFAGVPDLQARIVGQTVDDTAAWTEWDWTGTRRDGSSHHMRGVTITTVGREAITGVRFFMEPVTADGLDVAAAINKLTGAVGGRSAVGSES